MSNKIFNLRLSASYKGAENTIDELSVEIFNDGIWENLALSIYSPGFMLYINGLFSCQHLYMRTNSAERNAVLSSATGELQVETDENWHIQKIKVSFDAQIKTGQLSEADKTYILERLHHCPVSSNLPTGIVIDNVVRFY
jgi:hypothetical protein